jgi:hypothetical protein
MYLRVLHQYIYNWREVVKNTLDFPNRIYVFQKMNLREDLKYFLDKLQGTMPGTFLNLVENMVSPGDEFAEENLELAKYMKLASAALEYLDNKDTPAEMIPPFSALFLSTYRTIRIKSKPLADSWLRQAVSKHKRFLTTHGILARLPPDINIASCEKMISLFGSARCTVACDCCDSYHHPFSNPHHQKIPKSRFIFGQAKIIR